MVMLMAVPSGMKPEDLNPIETLKEYLHARKDTEVGESEVP